MIRSFFPLSLKTFKAPLKQANEEGLAEEGKTKIATTNKVGKAGMKTITVLSLTEKGEQYLRQSADPAALAATISGYFMGVKQSLEADRSHLRAEVQAAIGANAKGKGTDDGKTPKALEKLAEQVSALLEKVKKLESDLANQLEKVKPATQGTSDSAILDRIDQAFAAMRHRLDQTLNAMPAASRSDQPTPPSAAPLTLPVALRNAYDRLCRFIEFKDGVVELPRLYHETRKFLPNLTVKEFHDELMALWQRRELELHVLNEVHMAAEPDKGIDHNNKLYYYARWKPS